MSSTNCSFGLNLRLLSFELPHNLVKYSDTVRVSITTIPEENKQAFTISARKMKDSNLIFGVNVSIPQENLPKDFVSTSTEEIIFVFRKKTFFGGDPIIASTVINAKELPKNLSEPAIIKTFNIYEPRLKDQDEKHNDYSKSCLVYNKPRNNSNRRIVGRMQVQMSLTDPFHLKDLNDDMMFDLDNNTTSIETKYINQGNELYGFESV